jgi:hypothetical protein
MDFAKDSKSIPLVAPSFDIASNASTLGPDPLSERLKPQPAPVPSKHSTVRATIHDEKHGNHSDIIRDMIIGFADGLTVPFALTAGLSSYAAPFQVLSPPSIICLRLADWVPQSWSLSVDSRSSLAVLFLWV